MPGIIITPGSFNPPATPVQLVVGYPFPKVAVRTIRKWQQFSPKHVAEAEPPGILYPVVYSYYDFTNGDITVGVETESFIGELPNFRTDAVRYVPNALYAKIGQNATNKQYSALDATPPFAGEGVINFGTLDIEQGNAGISWSSLQFQFPYAMVLSGDTDLTLYSFRLLDASPDGSEDLSGTALLGFALPTVPFEGGVFSVNTTDFVRARLNRGGSVFDEIVMGFRIQGVLNFAALSGEVSATPQPDPIAIGGSWSDTLYGAEATALPVSPPGVDYAAYIRRSGAREGEVTLS